MDPEDIAAAKAKEKQQQLRLVEDPGTAKKKGRGMFVMNLTEAGLASWVNYYSTPFVRVYL